MPSFLHRERPRARQRGMTMIEIMIVIGVFALMVGMVVIGFSSGRNAETTRSVNKVANLLRYGYDKARVTGNHYRLLVDFEEKLVMLQESEGVMYLPATDRDGRLMEYDESKAREQADRDARAEESYNQSIQSQIYEQAGRDAAAAAADQAAAEVSYEDVIDPYKAHPRKVPRRKPPLFNRFRDENELSGLSSHVKFDEGAFKVVSLRTADDLKPITEGQASIYFFPRGRTQKAHILIEDEEGENKFTIIVAPLTGRVTIVDGHEELILPDDPGSERDELGNRQQRRTF